MNGLHRKWTRKMNTEQRDVLSFHLKHGFPVAQDINDCTDPDATDELRIASMQLKSLSKLLEAPAMRADAYHHDTRLWNIHLLVEEVGELAEAMSKHDEAEVCDALGDILYVALGVAVRYNLPAKKIFDEVHRSNMTKDYRSDNNGRLRNKGPNYSPPNMRKILEEFSDNG